MKIRPVLFLMVFACLTQVVSAQVQRNLPASLEFKFFKDSILVGYGNEVRVTNVGTTTVELSLSGCSVRPGGSTNVFTVLAPATLAGQEGEIIVSQSVNGVSKVILRRKVKFVAGTPQLLNRIQ